MTAVLATDEPTSVSALVPPSSARRARWVIIFLWTVGLFAIANALLAVAAALRGSDLSMEVLRERGDGNYDFDPMAAFVLLFTLFKALAFLASVVAYFVWVYRARVRQRWFSRHLGISDARGGISPTYSILVWFIPVMNFVLPYNDVHDLVTSEPSEPDDRRLLLPLWWGSWIVANVVGPITARVSDNPWLTVVGDGLFACAAFLAVRWIDEFERRTARRTVLPANRVP